MLSTDEQTAIADRLLDANATGSLIEPITASLPQFDLDDAGAVRSIITARRTSDGWTPVGRKIGFTNRTIWPRYGIEAPLWAPMWDRTVVDARSGVATVDLTGLPQPRIEPEVVFALHGPVAATEEALTVLENVEWMAAGFEIVQCPFPDWRFTLADGTAAFGLHGRLVVGERVTLDGTDRVKLADALTRFDVTLSRHADVVDRGTGANVLGSPALALAHLSRAVGGADALTAGEKITTGTITDAWPVAAGETWSSHYGDLGLRGLTVTFG